MLSKNKPKAAKRSSRVKEKPAATKPKGAAGLRARRLRGLSE